MGDCVVLYYCVNAQIYIICVWTCGEGVSSTLICVVWEWNKCMSVMCVNTFKYMLVCILMYLCVGGWVSVCVHVCGKYICNYMHGYVYKYVSVCAWWVNVWVGLSKRAWYAFYYVRMCKCRLCVWFCVHVCHMCECGWVCMNMSVCGAFSWSCFYYCVFAFVASQPKQCDRGKRGISPNQTMWAHEKEWKSKQPSE